VKEIVGWDIELVSTLMISRERVRVLMLFDPDPWRFVNPRSLTPP